jgi:tRNA(His) 5'-end guanylyltransferase
MATDKTSLGDRMKQYEGVTRNYVMRRTPVVIRLDGCHFHTFTRGFDKPCDEVLAKTMKETMQYLCQNIQNVKLGYTQSDEITLVLADYRDVNTETWFGNNIQKMASVSASMCAMYFNKRFAANVESHTFADDVSDEQISKWVIAHRRAMVQGAIFDARVFNVPQNDVLNNVMWRVRDCERNSKSSLAQANFSPKELQGVSGEDMVTMVKEKTGILWNHLDPSYKYGTFCIKNVETNEWDFVAKDVLNYGNLVELVDDDKYRLGDILL